MSEKLKTNVVKTFSVCRYQIVVTKLVSRFDESESYIINIISNSSVKTVIFELRDNTVVMKTATLESKLFLEERELSRVRAKISLLLESVKLFAEELFELILLFEFLDTELFKTVTQLLFCVRKMS